ncbi:MAG: zinc-binding dehydrogenase [Elusimicrobia bacterium]|nr:zinc-binding dehydrogenase [Elusimicrobiota bacterium]
MKAAVFEGANQPLAIKDCAIPAPARGEALIKVAACGVCHTDLHYLDHGVPTFKAPPIILGHEAAGVIEELGPEVSNCKPGDRVLIPAVFTCGACEYCRNGRENICRNMVMLGNHRDGAFADYVSVPAKDLIALPKEIPLQEGAIIADAISTPFHALKNRANLRAGDVVVVFGCGGVGINLVQLASAMGGVVVAVDINEKKLELAKAFGAWAVVHAGESVDISKEIRKITGGGADIAIEAIGNPKTMEQAFGCLKTGGRLIVLGYYDGAVTFPAGRIMFREMEIIGSLGCRPVDYFKIVELVKTGKLKLKELVTHRFSLAQVNEGLDLLRNPTDSVLRSIVIP